MLAAVWCVVVFPNCASAQQSKYNTHTNLAEITFAPNPFGKRIVTSVLANSDKAASYVKLYCRGGGGKQFIETASTSGAQVVYIDNPGHAISTNDIVVYVYGDGAAPLRTTVSSSATNSITMATGISQAGTTSDSVYELTQQGEMLVGTSALNLAGDILFAPPSDSPLYATLNANTSAVLTVTVGQ